MADFEIFKRSPTVRKSSKREIDPEKTARPEPEQDVESARLDSITCSDEKSDKTQTETIEES